ECGRDDPCRSAHVLLPFWRDPRRGCSQEFCERTQRPAGGALRSRCGVTVPASPEQATQRNWWLSSMTALLAISAKKPLRATPPVAVPVPQAVALSRPFCR